MRNNSLTGIVKSSFFNTATASRHQGAHESLDTLLVNCLDCQFKNGNVKLVEVIATSFSSKTT